MTNGTNGMGVVPKDDAHLVALLEASPAYIEARRAGTALISTPAAAPQINQLTGGSEEHHSALSAEAARFMPVMSVTAALERRQMIVSAIEHLLIEGLDGDYGVIPGTKKKTLLQPGAQKLDNLFGLVPQFETVEKVLDWTGQDHNGEPFFYFEIRSRLWRGDFLMGEGVGSCNSWESKYRFRTAERVCPSCLKENIRKSKEGGWYCWKKTEGCGATFRDGDESIEKQATGKKPNPDIHDVVNTVMKIATKRAHVAATINATSASEFFTQDLESKVQPKSEPLPKAPDKPWAKFGEMLAEFAKVRALLPDDFYRQILMDNGVRSPEEFKRGPKHLKSENEVIALACYRQLLKAAADAQALAQDPTTYEHYAASEVWS